MANELICTQCGWIGTVRELTFPSWVLDDDYPEYGGDCPVCGAMSEYGEIIDYEDDREETGGAMTEMVMPREQRRDILTAYRDRWFELFDGVETLDDYCAQAAADIQDEAFEGELRAAIEAGQKEEK